MNVPGAPHVDLRPATSTVSTPSAAMTGPKPHIDVDINEQAVQAVSAWFAYEVLNAKSDVSNLIGYVLK